MEEFFNKYEHSVVDVAKQLHMASTCTYDILWKESDELYIWLTWRMENWDTSFYKEGLKEMDDLIENFCFLAISNYRIFRKQYDPLFQ